MTATTTMRPGSFAGSPAFTATVNGSAITPLERWSQGSATYNEQERITVNVLTEPRERMHLPTAVLLLWLVVVLAAMWAGIVAIAWVVWHTL